MTTRNFLKITLMLTLLFASSVTFAQKQAAANRTPIERAENQTKWMKQNLAITDDQSKKAYDIIMNFAKQAGDIRTSAATDKRTQMKQAIENKNAALKSVLTPEQFRKYIKHTGDLQQPHRVSTAQKGTRVPVVKH